MAYTEYHERILNVVDICLAVEKICSIDEPLIASRSESAIARDVAEALGQEPPGGRRDQAGAAGQEALF